MLCLRTLPFAAPLLPAGVLLAVMTFAPPPVLAQGTAAADALLMRPVADGPPQRFGARRAGSRAGVQAGVQVGAFGNPPGFGAGTTGFDSGNGRRRKGKAAPKGVAARAAPSPPAAARLPQYRQRRGAPAAVAFATATGTALPAPTTTTPVIAAARRRPPEDDPFAPTGIQVGAFLLRPALEVTGAYDTNPARTARRTPSWYQVTAPELRVNSNWTRHELTANLRGSYTSYEELSSLNRPSFDGKLNGRIDVASDTRIELENRLIVGTDNPGSPNIPADLAKLPIYTTVGGTAGIAQRFNRVEVSLKGTADRTVYQDSVFDDGSTASNADRNYNRYGTQLRASYDLLPGVKPFVEIGGDIRRYDLLVDAGGVERNSDGRYAKAGTTFDFYRTLTGDVAVGYLMRAYKDPSLSNISGVTFDSSLVWVASALTTAKLTAKTSVDESTVVGVSGVFTREVALQVDHAFRRWLTATLKFARGVDDYVGSPRLDDRYAASAMLTYKLSPEWQIKTEYRREWLRSNEEDNDYTANVFLLGVRMQR